MLSCEINQLQQPKLYMSSTNLVGKVLPCCHDFGALSRKLKKD
jgi:hypothetical protein